jgi:LysM repeat protein
MKRLLLAAAGLVAGSLCFISPASAQPVDSVATSVSAVALPASGSPPKVLVSAVRTPTLPRYRVVSGDTLWSVGVRFHRGWPALAAYNRIPNADLIYVGQVLTIPPASYTGSYTVPAPARVSTPVPRHYSYSAPAQRPVSHYSAPSHSSYSGGSGSGSFTGVWACIAQYESGGNPSINTGNGYYGGLQFSQSTWAANGGSGNPANASAAEQQRVAENVVRASGGSYGAWPNTSRRCGV